MEVPTIETERTIMRGWREQDLDAYAEISGDPEVMQYLGPVQERAAAWRTIAMFIGHWQLRGYGLWAVERKSDGELLGRVGLWNPEGWVGVEIGWTLARHAWGSGYATECARSTLTWAWATMPELERIHSVIAPDNVLSRRVAERLGMEVVGSHQVGELETVLYGLERPLARNPAG